MLSHKSPSILMPPPVAMNLLHSIGSDIFRVHCRCTGFVMHLLEKSFWRHRQLLLNVPIKEKFRYNCRPICSFCPWIWSCSFFTSLALNIHAAFSCIHWVNYRKKCKWRKQQATLQFWHIYCSDENNNQQYRKTASKSTYMLAYC